MSTSVRAKCAMGEGQWWVVRGSEMQWGQWGQWGNEGQLREVVGVGEQEGRRSVRVRGSERR